LLYKLITPFPDFMRQRSGLVRKGH